VDVGQIVERIGETAALDRLAEPLQRQAAGLLSPRAKYLLSGGWLGHPFHPLLTDLPIGAWSSAAILDFVPGKSATRASRTLTGVGVALAAPTALAGVADWSELTGKDRRIGLVHAAANVVGLMLFTRSFMARVAGHHIKGRLWSLFGILAMTAGGYLGGHLTYRRGVGVEQQLELPLTDDDELYAVASRDGRAAGAYTAAPHG